MRRTVCKIVLFSLIVFSLLQVEGRKRQKHRRRRKNNMGCGHWWERLGNARKGKTRGCIWPTQIPPIRQPTEFVQKLCKLKTKVNTIKETYTHCLTPPPTVRDIRDKQTTSSRHGTTRNRNDQSTLTPVPASNYKVTPSNATPGRSFKPIKSTSKNIFISGRPGSTLKSTPAGKVKSTPTPVSKVTSTPTPVSKVTSTPSPVSKVKSTPTPVSKVTPTPSPVSKVKFTPTPVSKIKSPPIPVSKITSIPTPVSKVTSTPTPVSEVKYTPTPVSKVKYTTTPVSASQPIPSTTTMGATSPTRKVTTKKPETTVKSTEKNNEALENLAKNKVSNDNAKEVSKNLMKVFDQSHPTDMTKGDAMNAASVLEGIVSITQKLNETAGNMLECIDSFMEMNETTLADSRAAASKIIKVLDKIVEFIPFTDNTTSLFINKANIIIQANLVNPQTFQGINFGSNTYSNQSNSTGQSASQKYSLKLPRDVVQGANVSSVRIGFIYYASNKLFHANNSRGEKPSETVLSGSVFGHDVRKLNESVVIRFPLRPNDARSMRCGFWVDSALEWSSAGCSLCPHQSSKESVQCCCNHLTSFAVLFSPSPQVDDVHGKILSIISYLGCMMSLFGVTITFMTYSMFRRLRKTNQQPILMNLCIAIALLLIVFVAGINSTSNTLGCQIVAVLLHYLTLVTVLWMGIEAYNLYLQIVKVMAIYQRKFMLKAAMVGWGVPLIIVVATIAVALFKHQENEGNKLFYYGNRQLCILHNQDFRLITWFGPVLGVLSANLISFILIVYKLNNRYSIVSAQRKSHLLKNCLTALAIMCLLGVTWLFGALAISDARIVFEYLFCIFNSLQGFFIFFFHCVRIKEVRSQWSEFVSGLGPSQRYNDNSQKKSRDMQNIGQESDSIGMRNMTYRHAYQMEDPTAKMTVLTMTGDQGQTDTETKDGRSFSNCSHYRTEF